MTTTIMRDSIIGDDWIRQTANNVPVQRKIGADGQPTGDILTGPVRLAFCESIFAPSEKPEGEGKFSVLALYTPFFDPRIFYEEYYAACAREYPQHYDAGSQQYFGLHSPFKDQSEKLNYGGFTPGLVCMTHSTQYRPQVVDVRGNTIVDPNKLYAGVWALLAVKPYAFGKAGKTKDGQPMKKGIGFGLQSIMLIADDTRFGGGGPDAKALFAGVNIPTPIARPDLGAMPSAAVPAPAAGIPGYTAMGGGVPTPGMPQQQMHIPQQHYAPPVAQPQGFTPAASAGYAGAPQAAAPMYAPPATTSPSDEEDMSFLYR